MNLKLCQLIEAFLRERKFPAILRTWHPHTWTTPEGYPRAPEMTYPLMAASDLDRCKIIVDPDAGGWYVADIWDDRVLTTGPEFRTLHPADPMFFDLLYDDLCWSARDFNKIIEYYRAKDRQIAALRSGR